MELKPPPFVLVFPEKISSPKEISNPPSLLPPMTLSFCTYQPKSGLSALKLVRDRVSNLSASEALRGANNRASRITLHERAVECEKCILLIDMVLIRANSSVWFNSLFYAMIRETGTDRVCSISRDCLIVVCPPEFALPDIRYSLNKGLVLGTEQFKTEVEVLTGRRVRPARRKRKSAKTTGYLL
jgi:hypothetical protein